jgi:hypothetical protein
VRVFLCLEKIMPRTGIEKRISAASDRILNETFNNIRRAALAGHNAAVATTPVDTGFARSQWGISVGAPASSESDALSINSLDRWKGDASIFIVNPVPYTEFLDEGSSDQSPGGMTKFAVQAIRQALKG